MTTYTSQPDGTDGIDAHINAGSSTTNYGTNTGLFIGNGSGATKRGLIKFDLSKGTNPPPSNAVVSSATLTLTVVADWTSNARTMSAYRVKRNWTEAGVTWDTYNGTNNWGTAGCANTSTDREGSAIGTAAVGDVLSAGDTIAISLDAASVQEWISGAMANYGLLLKVDTENTDQVNYASSDNATAGYRPQLVIEYTTPAAGTFVARIVSF